MTERCGLRCPRKLVVSGGAILKYWMQLKQSPEAVACLVFVAIKIAFYFQEPSMTWRVEVYFGAVLFFCAWCFQKNRNVQTSELSDDQREKFAQLWQREVEGATRDLARYTKLVSTQGRSYREWTDREVEDFREYLAGCYLTYLVKLAHEFKLEDRRVVLKRWWECADTDEQAPQIPSTKELWGAK